MLVDVINQRSSTPARATVIGNKHEEVRLSSGQRRSGIVRPLHTCRPSDGPGRVRDLQSESERAACRRIRERERRVSGNRLGEVIASRAIYVQNGNGNNVLSVVAG